MRDEGDEWLGERARRALADYAPPPPPGLVDRVMTATRAPTRAARATRRQWMAAAGALAVVAAAALVLALSRRPAPADLATHVAIAHETVQLGEQGRVALDPGAAIRWNGDGEVEQLAGTARYQIAHRGRPFVVRTPAGTVTDVGTTFEVEVNPMEARNKQKIVAGVAVAVVLAVFVYEGKVKVASRQGAVVASAGQRVLAVPDEAPRLVPMRVVVAGPPDAARVERREALERAIRAARARREASAPSAARSPGPADEPAPAGLEATYIRQQVRAVLPLVAECYSHALEDHPGLEGTMVVNFTVSGEPGVGGLVTSSEIDPSSTIDDAGMAECVSQNMYAVELDPPTGGGEVRIAYPFAFSP